MSDIESFGTLNAHIVGIVMKEAVRRAITAIRSQRFSFEVRAKAGYDGAMNDLVTSADLAAQAIYVKMFRECLPLCGIVAEEDGVREPCKIKGHNVFCTIDGVDGTKALGRKQSHGIGTMASLVDDKTVIAAFVGDANSQEIYGYRPLTPVVHRISQYDYAEPLKIDDLRPLAVQNVMVRRDRESFSPLLRKLLRPSQKTFHAIEAGNGSIGLSMARMWKGEVGAFILEPCVNAPWDYCPIVGISKRLGFVFYRFTEGGATPFEPVISDQLQKVDFDTLIIHKSRVDELQKALARLRK